MASDSGDANITCVLCQQPMLPAHNITSMLCSCTYRSVCLRDLAAHQNEWLDKIRCPTRRRTADDVVELEVPTAEIEVCRRCTSPLTMDSCSSCHEAGYPVGGGDRTPIVEVPTSAEPDLVDVALDAVGESVAAPAENSAPAGNFAPAENSASAENSTPVGEAAPTGNMSQTGDSMAK